MIDGTKGLGGKITKCTCSTECFIMSGDKGKCICGCKTCSTEIIEFTSNIPGEGRGTELETLDDKLCEECGNSGWKVKVIKKGLGVAEPCPHCGTYCTCKSVFCTPPIEKE